ncbi:MAG: hypothetical protein HC789_12815 [Microcoleus sp. CSU_2_2]|nr:hypothetical protein [Microcoleus sp. SU_5_3]NJS11188.1 hypothetical protein [Microcoleus sp. CSU_2_2]
MMWKAYRVVFKLRSPMHIGCGKAGNVQRTRPYVTGRVFWGALTMRLTRDATNGPATNSKQYEEFGEKVHNQLAYTYFYPAIACAAAKQFAQSKNNSEETQNNHPDYQIAFSWQNESLFRRCFLSSYASTALVYPQQAADEGLLHEVEFISPRTLDTGKQVYLIGYVFEKEGCNLKWKDACKRLQMGGERGYGWGMVELVCNPCEITHSDLFNGQAQWQEENGAIAINVASCDNLTEGQLLAHTSSANLLAQGEIEPLVGREWRSNESTNRYAGQYVSFCDLCWIPGSAVAQNSNFAIEEFGIWQLL